MAMRVKSGTLVMCMAMALPYQIYCVLASSRANPSLAAPTLVASIRKTVIIYESLTERIIWWVSGKTLTGVTTENQCSCMRRKMVNPARTGQAAADSDLKSEMYYPLISFFWLFRVRTIWVACWRSSIGGSAGSIISSTKKINSRRVRNCTVPRCMLYLVYLHNLRQK